MKGRAVQLALLAVAFALMMVGVPDDYPIGWKDTIAATLIAILSVLIMTEREDASDAEPDGRDEEVDR